jgi:hypothetical protein
MRHAHILTKINLSRERLTIQVYISVYTVQSAECNVYISWIKISFNEGEECRFYQNSSPSNILRRANTLIYSGFCGHTYSIGVSIAACSFNMAI